MVADFEEAPPPNSGPRLKGAQALEQAEEDSEERRRAERGIKRAPVFLETGGC